MRLKQTLIPIILLLVAKPALGATCADLIEPFKATYDCVKAETFGEGAAGKVLLVRPKDRPAAPPQTLKIINALTPAIAERARREAEVLRAVKNFSHVIKLLDTKELDKKFYLFMEYGDKGDLTTYIDTLDFDQNRSFHVLQLWRQVVAGVAAVHEARFVHADLKTDNIVMFSPNILKLIDFDIAVPLGQSAARRGTLPYMEPSLLALHPENFTFDEFVDIYALGVILYQLAFENMLPFEDENQDTLINRVVSGEYELPAGASHDIAYLIHECLKFDRVARPSTKHLFALIDKFCEPSNKSQTLEKLTLNTKSPLPEQIMTPLGPILAAVRSVKDEKEDSKNTKISSGKSIRPSTLLGTQETKGKEAQEKDQMVFLIVCLITALVLSVFMGILVCAKWGDDKQTSGGSQKAVAVSPEGLESSRAPLDDEMGSPRKASHHGMEFAQGQPIDFSFQSGETKPQPN